MDLSSIESLGKWLVLIKRVSRRENGRLCRMVNAEEIYPESVASTAVNHKGKYGDRQSRQSCKFLVSGTKSFDGRLTDF